LQPLWIGLYGQILDHLQGLIADNRWAEVGGERKPLMQLLKELPRARVDVPAEVTASADGDKARFEITLTNRDHYARLIQVRLEWKNPEDKPLLETYSDNFADLFPCESETIRAEIRFATPIQKTIQGTLVIEGANVEAIRIPVSVNASK
jgi:hypothetical protein